MLIRNDTLEIKRMFKQVERVKTCCRVNGNCVNTKSGFKLVRGSQNEHRDYRNVLEGSKLSSRARK